VKDSKKVRKRLRNGSHGLFTGGAIRSGRGVLFIDSQGLGDVVQTLPLLQAICRWSETRWPLYVLFASPEYYEILREEKLALSAIFVRGNSDGWDSWPRIWWELVGKIDLIVSAPEISAAKLLLLKYALAARYAIGEAPLLAGRFLTSSVKRSWIMPWSETVDEIAAMLGLAMPLPPPAIHLTLAEINWARNVLARACIGSSQMILGVQCSSCVPQKCWPAENFAELVRSMHRQFPGLGVISFGTRAERGQAHQVHTLSGNIPWLEGTGQWSIRQSMAMLSQCSLFISGDTGLMHIAAALGVRTVSIFGPTAASRRAPQHNGGVAVCPHTSCHPCFRGRWAPCECIQSIASERVFAAAEELLSAPVNRCTFDSSVLSEPPQTASR
jgi:ADP-heptose:LPS heptosyltransferase